MVRMVAASALVRAKSQESGIGSRLCHQTTGVRCADLQYALTSRTLRWKNCPLPAKSGRRSGRAKAAIQNRRSAILNSATGKIPLSDMASFMTADYSVNISTNLLDANIVKAFMTMPCPEYMASSQNVRQ